MSRVAAPTGVAAFNIDGQTLYSLLKLRVRGEFKDLQGESLSGIQECLSSIKYLNVNDRKKDVGSSQQPYYVWREIMPSFW